MSLLFVAEMTPEQRARAEESRARIEARRARAEYVPLISERPSSNQGINCARCVHIGDLSSEHQVGWCILLRHQVGTWHNSICRSFERET